MYVCIKHQHATCLIPHHIRGQTQHSIQSEMFRRLSSFPVRFLGILGACESLVSAIENPQLYVDPEIQNDSNKVTRENAQCILHGPSRITFTILYPNPPHDQHITSVRQPLSAAYCSKRTNKKQDRNNKHNKHGDFRSAFVSYRTSTLVQKPGKSCFFLVIF